MSRSSLSIRDVVDLSVLQRIQDTFSKAMGCAAVTVDRSGAPITVESNFLPICRMIRSTSAGLARCMACDAEGGLQAQRQGGPCVYRCAGGLVDIAAPIMIEDEYIGCILCGQVVPDDAQEEFVEEIVERNARLGLPAQDVRAAAWRIPTLPRERVDAAAEMLFCTANHIVEMGVANLTQGRLLRETQEKATLQAALQTTQLRMLQSQVNPHFLFNTLGLISYTAIQENAPVTEEVAYCLSDLLRYSLRNVAKGVTLGREVETIERYLTIQKLRFGDRLQTRFEIEPTLRQRQIPCMTLQPLVENAVIHAVEPLARPVHIEIRATRVADRIKLEVIDDGAGMESALAEAINRRAFRDWTDGSSVGLKNVIQRLQEEYGAAFALHVASEPDHGTHVTIELPLADNRHMPVPEEDDNARFIGR